MDKDSLELIDNLIDNWDKNIERTHSAFSKLDTWSGNVVKGLIKRYDTKLENLDMFKEIELSGIYEHKKSENLILLNIECKKDAHRFDKNGENKEKGKVSWTFKSFILIKLSEEYKGISDSSFKNEHYKMVESNALLNFDFKVYGKDYNIDILLDSLEDIDYSSDIELLQMENVSFENLIPGEHQNSYSYHKNEIDINFKGEYQSDISKNYLEYKKKSSKRNELNEKFSFFKKKKKKYNIIDAMQVTDGAGNEI